MPRATQSRVTGMLEFFRTLSIETAELIYGQVRDLMQDRRGRQRKAKARVVQPTATPAPAAAPAKAKTSHTKKVAPAAKKVKAPTKKKKKAPRPVNTPLPDVGADDAILTPKDDE